MILAFVEGEGEALAVPLLLRRLVWEMQVFDVQIGTAVRRTRDRLAGRDGLRATMDLARRIKDVEGVLLLLDADDDCPAVEGPRITEWLRDVAPDVRSGLVMANREYEAWFLASWETMTETGDRARLMNDPDVPRDAKGRVARGLGIRYHEPFDQVRLTNLIDLRVAAQRSRSFRKLVMEVERLLRRCGRQPISFLGEVSHGQG
ncbi:MAG: DUF4276 family protein [bacterium]|nr:DUF4276 family protein [bacterium]